MKIATTTRTLYKTGAEGYVVDEKGETKRVDNGHVSTVKIVGYTTKKEADAKSKEIKEKVK